MEMLNRAIEEAREFEEFQRKLRGQPTPRIYSKHPGESRREFRKRVREETKHKEKMK